MKCRQVNASSGKAYKWKSIRQPISRWAGITMLLVGIFATSGLVASPVTVPTLTTPGFRSQDLDPLFEYGFGETSESSWLALVNGGVTVISADWETDADAEIDRLFNETVSANAGMTEAEKTELRNALIAQKNTQKAAWDASADQLIEEEQAWFIQDLAYRHLPDLPGAAAAVDTAELDNYIQQAFDTTFTLSDWDNLVQSGAAAVASAFEAVAVPAIEAVAAAVRADAEDSGTISTTFGSDIFESSLLQGLDGAAFDVLTSAIGDRIRAGLADFIGSKFDQLTVPELTLNAFDPATVQPYIDAAAHSATIADWNAAVVGGRDYEFAAWRTEAEWTRDIQVGIALSQSGLTGQDANVYELHLMSTLDEVVQSAGDQWLAASTGLIDSRRASFQSDLDSGLTPALKLASFPVLNFEYMFISVSQAATEADWQGAVYAGRDALLADWSTDAEARIDAAVEAARTDNPSMTAAEETDLRTALGGQRDSARDAWQEAAAAMIESERRPFLLTLLSSQLALQLPEITGFQTEDLDPIIQSANAQTGSPSEWRSIVEAEVQVLFEAWLPTVEGTLDQSATAAVDEAVTGGLISSDTARELALDLIRQSLQAEASDLYLDAALGYTSDVFIERIDEIFSGIATPQIDTNLLGFNASVLTPTFTSAQTSTNSLQWTNAVNDGKQAALREWFTTLLNHVTGLMDSTVSGSGLSGEDAQVLRDYLEFQLDPEIQQARRDWEVAASTLVGDRRMEFMMSLEPEVAAVNESGAPVLQITPLTAPGFDQDSLFYIFDLIKNASTVGQWEQLAKEGVYNLADVWQTQVDAMIDTIVTDVTAGVTNDTFETITFEGVAEGEGTRINSILAYKDYVRSYLSDQKNLQFAIWTYEAEQLLEIGRESYLAGRDLSAIEAQQDATSASIFDSTRESRDAQSESEQNLDPNRERKPYELAAEQAIAQARRQLELGELEWRSDWRDRRDEGLTRYNQALYSLDQHRDQYLYTMQQSDLAWQTNIAMMEQFEANMRGGIDMITGQLQEMIAMNALFHTDVECPEDRRSSCVLTPGNDQDGTEPIYRELNGAGQAFKEKLDALQAALDSGAPLSAIVQEIQLALENMATHARERRNYWAGHIQGDARLTEEFQWADYVAPNAKGKYSGIPQHEALMSRGPSYYQGGVRTNISDTQIVYRRWVPDPTPPGGGGFDGYGGYDDFYGDSSPGGHYETKVLGDLLDDPSTWDFTTPGGDPISADMGTLLRMRQLAFVYDAADAGADAATEWERFLEEASQEQRQIVDGSAGAGRACGRGESVSADAAYGFRCSDAAGLGAFTYYASSGQHGLFTGRAPVRYIDVDVPYTWFDVNADANWKVWDEALASIMAVSAHWVGEVLPNVEAWERQVADYKTGYAEWQAESADRIAEYEAAYQAGKERLLANRAEFLFDMDEEWADGRAQYTEAYENLNEIELEWQEVISELLAAGEDADEDLVAELQSQLDAVVNSISIDRVEIPEVEAELEEIFGELPELEEDFVTRFQEDTPDPTLIEGVVQQFAEVAQGMVNFAMLHAVGDMMEAAREDYIDRVVQILESIGEAEQGELPEKPYTAYEVVVHDDGSISGSRTIYSGRADEIGKDRRGYALKPEHYQPEMITQTIFFSAPQANKIPELGNLFETSSQAAMGLINESFQSAGEGSSSSFAFVDASVGEQMEVAHENVDTFFKDRQGRIAKEQNAKEHDEKPGKIFKSILAVASTLVGCVPCGAALVAWSAAEGFRDGGIVGALSGIVSGAVSSFTSAFGVSVDLSYSYEDGFGGSIGLGLGEGGAGLGLNVGFGSQAGVGIGWTGSAAGGSGLDFGLKIDKNGIGVNAGVGDFTAGLNYNYENGFGGTIGYDSGQGFTAGLGWSESGGFSGNLGLNLGKGYTAGLAYSEGNGLSGSLDRAAQDLDMGILSNYIQAKGSFGLNLSGDGLGLTNTFDYQFQTGNFRGDGDGFRGWGGGPSGGSFFGQSGSVRNSLNFGFDGDVNLTSDTTARFSSEYLNSRVADRRDKWLTGTEYAYDEYGNRVKRLALEDRLIGTLAESGQYALCPGEDGTKVCVLQGDGTYADVDLTPEQLIARLQETYGNRLEQAYGNSQFNLEHLGAGTDFTATQNGAQALADQKLGIAIGVENTTGANLLQVLSNLAGEDAGGQGQAYADLLEAIYTTAGPEALHRVIAEGDGSSITATANYLLNQNGYMDALGDHNAWLESSMMGDQVWNMLAGNGSQHWTDLTNVYDSGGGFFGDYGFGGSAAGNIAGYLDLYRSMDGRDMLPLPLLEPKSFVPLGPDIEELLANMTVEIKPIEITPVDTAKAIREILENPNNELTQEQIWELEDALAKVEGREPPKSLERDIAAQEALMNDESLTPEQRIAAHAEYARLVGIQNTINEIERVEAALNEAQNCGDTCDLEQIAALETELEELKSDEEYLKHTGEGVMNITDPDVYMQQLGKGLGPVMRDFLEEIRENPDTLAFDADLAAERDAKKAEIAALEDQLKTATGAEATRLRNQIKSLNNRVAAIDALEDRFDAVKEFLLSDDEDMTDEERLDYLAKNTVGSLCNVISYCLFGQAEGLTSDSFMTFFQDHLQQGGIGGANNAYYHMGSGTLEQQWGMVRRDNGGNAIGQDAALEYLRNRNVAITRQDTNGNGSPNHFMLITRNSSGNWVNADHTSTRKSRRGSQVDWSKVYSLRYLAGGG